MKWDAIRNKPHCRETNHPALIELRTQFKLAQGLGCHSFRFKLHTKLVANPARPPKRLT